MTSTSTTVAAMPLNREFTQTRLLSWFLGTVLRKLVTRAARREVVRRRAREAAERRRTNPGVPRSSRRWLTVGWLPWLGQTSAILFKF